MFSLYLTYKFDAAHFFELLFLATSWVVLENKPWRSAKETIRSVCEILALFALLLLLDIVVTYSFPTRFLFLWPFAQGAVSAVYVFSRSRERSRAGFALWCSMYAGSISLAAIGGQFSIILGTVSSLLAWQGVARVFCMAMSVLLAAYLNAKRLDKYEHIPGIGLVMILAGDFCLFLLRWLETRWFMLYFQYAVVYAAAYFCVLILVLCSVYGVDSICREQAKGLQLLAEKQRAESERNLVSLTQKQLDDLRQLRHDIKNQYAYMHILLAERRYEELEEYFVALERDLTLRTMPLDCGNRCISIVLNTERQKAEAVGVSLHTKLVVPPVLPFPDDDMCSLLSNLIDNAIDECVRLGKYFPEISGQGVSLSINPGNPCSDYLYIEVKNPTDRKNLIRRTGGIVSTKGDAVFHGYGTRIITRLAEKYNGSALFEAADGVFTARVILDMLHNKEEMRS